MGFGAAALIAPEPRKARRRAKLPGARLLRAGDFERAFEVGLRFRGVALGRQQFDFAGNAMDLRLAPPFARRLRRRQRFADAAPRVVELPERPRGPSPDTTNRKEPARSLPLTDRRRSRPRSIWTASDGLPVSANTQPSNHHSDRLPEEQRLFRPPGRRFVELAPSPPRNFRDRYGSRRCTVSVTHQRGGVADLARIAERAVGVG